MLKLEKVQGKGITMRFRQRERFLNSLLWKAFGIALAFHLSLFLLFHIQPFKIGSSTIFPPVQVDADIPSDPLALKIFPSFSFPEEQWMAPPLPSFLISVDHVMLDQQENIKEHLILLSSLSKQQGPLYSPFHEPASFPLFYHPIQVEMAGPLAERSLLGPKELVDPHLLPKTGDLKEIVVSYEVRMDEKTGTIFWYNSKNKAREAKWNRLAEDLLLNLTFTPNPQKIDLAGEIAFIFKSNSQAKERSHD